MRYINRSAILEILRLESPLSRTYLAKRLNISLPTVMRIVDELIDDDLVRPLNETEWSGGRRRSLLEFAADSSTVIGVDLGGTKMYGALADLGGNVLEEILLPQHDTHGENSYIELVELIEALLEKAVGLGIEVRGIGVGAPGITLHEEGIVTWAPSLGWRNYPLKTKLSEHFKLPVIVDNDVNLAALGELWFGVGHNCKNMVLISVGTGIGAGIVIDGALYRGSHQASGEIGYLLPGLDFLGKRYEGFGALESIASGTGITARAQQLIRPLGDEFDGEDLSARAVFEAMRTGAEWAKTVVNETVDYLAIAIATISVLFDPDLIVLGGGVSRSADVLIDPILNRLDGAIPIKPKIVASMLERRAAVMGAVTNVLHNTDEYYIVRKLA
jgi:glucokinase